MDWGTELPLPRQYAPLLVRREPGTVAGWTAGDVAELVRYVKWAGRTRGGRERRETHPFSNLVTVGGEAQGKGA